MSATIPQNEAASTPPRSARGGVRAWISASARNAPPNTAQRTHAPDALGRGRHWVTVRLKNVSVTSQEGPPFVVQDAEVDGLPEARK